eukprot:jgi/Bigna1/84043/fgenesh1_pg.121_\
MLTNRGDFSIFLLRFITEASNSIPSWKYPTSSKKELKGNMGGTVGKKLANHSAFELGGSDFVYGSVIARKVFECNKGSKLQKDKLIRYVGQLLSLRGFGREEEHSIKGGNLKKVLKERKATLFNTAKKILDELQVKAASAFDLFGEEGGGEKKSEADSSKEDDASLKPWDIVKVWNISDQNLNGQWGIISPENKATNTTVIVVVLLEEDYSKIMIRGVNSTDYIVLMQKPCAVPKAKIKDVNISMHIYTLNILSLKIDDDK